MNEPLQHHKDETMLVTNYSWIFQLFSVSPPLRHYIEKKNQQLKNFVWFQGVLCLLPKTNTKTEKSKKSFMKLLKNFSPYRRAVFIKRKKSLERFAVIGFWWNLFKNEFLILHSLLCCQKDGIQFTLLRIGFWCCWSQKCIFKLFIFRVSHKFQAEATKLMQCTLHLTRRTLVKSFPSLCEHVPNIYALISHPGHIVQKRDCADKNEIIWLVNYR